MEQKHEYKIKDHRNSDVKFFVFLVVVFFVSVVLVILSIIFNGDVIPGEVYIKPTYSESNNSVTTENLVFYVVPYLSVMLVLFMANTIFFGYVIFSASRYEMQKKSKEDKHCMGSLCSFLNYVEIYSGFAEMGNHLLGFLMTLLHFTVFMGVSLASGVRYLDVILLQSMMFSGHHLILRFFRSYLVFGSNKEYRSWKDPASAAFFEVVLNIIFLSLFWFTVFFRASDFSVGYRNFVCIVLVMIFHILSTFLSLFVLYYNTKDQKERYSRFLTVTGETTEKKISKRGFSELRLHVYWFYMFSDFIIFSGLFLSGILNFVMFLV